MPIAATFVLAYYLRIVRFVGLHLYFVVFGFVVMHSDDEIDLAKEVQDFCIMVEEHVTVIEGGPIITRIIALLIDAIFITEEI